jgi:dTDP-4-dehydrorhamnose 3,5-epimerase
MTVEPRFGQELPSFSDQRGVFGRLWDKRFSSNQVVNLNASVTYSKGSIRGFHLQRGHHSEEKIIRVLHGRIFDIVIDLNPNSDNYGSTYSFELSVESKPLVIPRFFAHAFQALTDFVVVTYGVDRFYEPHAELGINPLSPEIQVNWPVEPTVISEKDKNLPDRIFEDVTKCNCL